MLSAARNGKSLTHTMCFSDEQTLHAAVAAEKTALLGLFKPRVGLASIVCPGRTGCLRPTAAVSGSRVAAMDSTAPAESGLREAQQGRAPLVRLGSLPVDSEQGLRFVQDRLGIFSRTTFLISSMFLVATTVADQFAVVVRYPTPARASHVVGSLLALGLWRLAVSSRALSPSALQRLDLGVTLGICWAFTMMGHCSLQPYGFYTALLAVTHVSISRAMIVPSLPRRTLLIGVLGFAGLVVSRALLPLPAGMEGVPGARLRGVLDAVLWSTAGTAVAALSSNVIYGLRKKALQARQLGQYALEAKIGEGGMGEVFRARHAMLRRPTAVKLLSGDGSETQLRRFEKEVRLTARLTHPNTISIYDYGRTPEGVFYYAMELLDGMTLEQLVEKHGPLPASRVIHLILQVSGALREAHQSGLIHRDIKPANIFVGRHGGIPDFIKVLDFGLVREVKGESDLTASNLNAVVGSPLYMSPEAILTPDRIDARADIYGLGCVMYFLITGAPPFSGQTVVEVCAHHLHTPPEPPSLRVSVPADLERVVLACLAKEPAARPASAREIAEALTRCADAEGWGEAAAEAWWAAHPALPTRSEPQPASAEKPYRTIWCGDLQQRLQSRDESA